MTATPFVSIIIVTHDGLRKGVLPYCLICVVHGTAYPNFEVLVVVNGSQDGTADYVRSNFPEVRLIENRENHGFAEGNNIGLREAKGEYFFLLNDDAVIVEEHWLSEIVGAVESSTVGAAQSKLIMFDPKGGTRAQYGTVLDCGGGLLDYYGYHYERGRGCPVNSYKRIGPIFYGKGASLLLKREALEKVGIFDSDFFMQYDEVDLCWRLRLGGYEILYVPKSLVYHEGGTSPKRLYLHTRNHLLVLLKNYNLRNASVAVGVSILFEMRNFAKFAIQRRPAACLAILKAFGWNLWNFRRTWRKRLDVQTFARRVSDDEVKRAMLKPTPPFPLYLKGRGAPS